ncbi:MAG TPA: hypothetical protein VGK79_09600 [Gaiellaceae bacterium]|jgi:hypothetical protein
MRRLIALLAISVATATAFAASAAAAPPSIQVVIRHQMRGCHAWSVAGSAFKSTQTVTTKHGTMLSFMDNDIMPHTLVQLSGPKVTLHTPAMGRIGAEASLRLVAKGRYVFTTKAGEDYTKGSMTMGEDNVLKLIVFVR